MCGTDPFTVSHLLKETCLFSFEMPQIPGTCVDEMHIGE